MEHRERKHTHFNDGHLPAIAEKYLERLTESVRDYPQRTTEQHISSLHAAHEDKGHWYPIARELDFATAEKFTWKSENGHIQNYRSEETQGWLHIDRHGTFYDRHAQPISREVALESAGHALSGASMGVSRPNDQVDRGLGVS